MPVVSRATTSAVIPISASFIAVATPVGVAVLTETVFVVCVLVPKVNVISNAFPPFMVCAMLVNPTTGPDVLASRVLEVCAFAGLVTFMECVPEDAEVLASKVKAVDWLLFTE